DASEAEAALREAWDVCLTQGIVHPAVLAMDEIPHDKAPARMHEPHPGMRRPVSAFSQSAELTTVDPVPAALKQAPAPPVAAPAPVIEGTKKRVGDDDPTLMMSPKSGPKEIVNDTIPAQTIPDSAKTEPQVTFKVKATPEPKKSLPLPVMIAIAVVLLAAATAGGLYLGGIIG
ncbi:MAG TPA: hypothetical protein VLT45_18235, partial [Kofleriaceae bacterium]|nr:hypothetical protein [Kofleriaceae bacterium]